MTASKIVFYQTKVATKPFFFIRQVKATMAVNTDEKTATTRLAWLMYNVSIT